MTIQAEALKTEGTGAGSGVAGSERYDDALPGARKRKLAEIISERIQQDIEAIGWPVGQVLGNEVQLMETYGVSRATLREAIRQLERHGVVTMRRGFGGGLVIQEPARMAAVQGIATYLELTDVSLDELFEARTVLELQAVDLASQRVSDEDILALRNDVRLLLETPMENIKQEVHFNNSIRRTIAVASHNVALALFLEALNRVTGALMPDYDRLAQHTEGRLKLREAKAQLVEAIISGNRLVAEQAVLTELAASKQSAKQNLEQFRREAKKKGAMDIGTAPQIADWDASQKLPHRLAVVIAREVAQRKLAEGTRIGSEPEFLARFGVSRAVFREAIRMLEGYGIVRMRRGFGGGLVVGYPDPAHTISLVIGYLKYTKLSPAHFYEVLFALEVAMAPLAAARAPQARIEALQARLAAMEGKSRGVMMQGLRDNFMALQCSIGNRAISLMGSIISDLSPGFEFELPPLNVCKGLIQCHSDLLAAVAARDEGLARRMVIRLLKAMDLWWGDKQRKLWIESL
ncbi:MAG: GntR family transcriptional regulator [Rhodocyclaceae bacterium]|jgi:DNA-binding FadR family transcriptional regulator|nr:GntR family transcriptional regulator [Rhodocyclaceae bacterium]